MHSDAYPSSTQRDSGALHAGFGAVLCQAAETSESRRNPEGKTPGPPLSGAGRENTRTLPELNLGFNMAIEHDIGLKNISYN